MPPAATRNHGPSRKHAEAASSAATTTNVRCVPIAGMRINAGRKTPTSEPPVESAYSLPATAPAVSTSTTASLMANGDTIPSSTTGGAQRSSTARKLPTTAPTDASSRPSTVSRGTAWRGRGWPRRRPRPRGRWRRGARGEDGGRQPSPRASTRARGRRARSRSGSPTRSSTSRSRERGAGRR